MSKIKGFRFVVQIRSSDSIPTSDGRAINNSAPLFALVLLSMGKTPEAKKAFMEIFPQVVRTASHFYEWLAYTKSLRGFGKVIREVGKQWLSREDIKGLAYQLLKYQQRNGFSHRDALRLYELHATRYRARSRFLSYHRRRLLKPSAIFLCRGRSRGFCSTI